MLVPGSSAPHQQATSSTTKVARPMARMSTCTAVAAPRPPAGSDVPPAAPASRGLGHRMRNATNEISSANAAPYATSQTGNGRSVRPPTPWARTGTIVTRSGDLELDELDTGRLELGFEHAGDVGGEVDLGGATRRDVGLLVVAVQVHLVGDVAVDAQDHVGDELHLLALNPTVHLAGGHGARGSRRGLGVAARTRCDRERDRERDERGTRPMDNGHGSPSGRFDQGTNTTGGPRPSAVRTSSRPATRDPGSATATGGGAIRHRTAGRTHGPSTTRPTTTRPARTAASSAIATMTWSTKPARTASLPASCDTTAPIDRWLAARSIVSCATNTAGCAATSSRTDGSGTRRARGAATTHTRATEATTGRPSSPR